MKRENLLRLFTTWYQLVKLFNVEGSVIKRLWPVSQTDVVIR